MKATGLFKYVWPQWTPGVKGLNAFQYSLVFNEKIYNPARIYWLKVNNKNRKRLEICSKLTIRTSERW